ncbi:hypothetical protein [Legionella brunensis]|uniref:Transmembrane protein n=2 Tax=Legionella brunensis TaxID=29422 RepID=A0A0W0SU86_9GAMM|nr:hypothetical protein [Legionella brunensis]KTC86934.1 hypothetical protein Lbru_0163 [Legionella brunensis]
MWRFIRRHWAASLAVLLAVLTAAAAVAAVVAFPPSILAIANFSVFGATPFAFLSTLSFPAAVASIGAMTFAASLTASTLFNAVVSIYNFMNTLIQPKSFTYEFQLKSNVEDDEEDLDESPSLMSKLLGCCKKKPEEPKPPVNEEPNQFKDNLFPEQKPTKPAEEMPSENKKEEGSDLGASSVVLN